MIYKRPAVFVAVFCVLLIIVLRPFIPQPQESFRNNSQPNFLSKKFSDTITNSTPKPYDALLSSLVFGSSAIPMDFELKQKYKRVGLSHLLVASGTQVSILLGTSFAIFRWLRVNNFSCLLIISFLNWTFAFVAGFGPSIIRASIMGQIILFGKLFNRDPDIYSSLSIAAIIMIIYDPLIIFDIGFQLTFCATWSLVYLAPIFEGRGMYKIFSVSLAPVLATFPIVIYNFGQVSVFAVLTNVLVMPFVEFVTILGFFSTILGTIFIPIAEILNFSVVLMLKVLNGIVYIFSEPGFSSFYIRSPGIIIVFAYYFLLVFFAGHIKDKIMLKKEKIFIIILFLASAIVLNFSFAETPSHFKDELQVSVIDVGQGDSIFLKTPEGKTVLIDGGAKFKRGNAGSRYVLPFLRKEGINNINLLVLTHPHDDHVGGLPYILKNINVELVFDPGKVHTSKSYMEFLKIIKEKNIEYENPRFGDFISFESGVCLEILNPKEANLESCSANNSSIVILLKYKDFSALLMGDAEKEVEENIIGDISHKINMLKVGHHGSRTATSNEFIAAIYPEIAVISVGKDNRFNHPHSEVLERLDSSGIKTYRTDIDKTVTLRTDGKKYIISSQ